MKKIKVGILSILLFVMLIPSFSNVSGCTIFTVAIEDSVYFAGNEDGTGYRKTGIKIEPASEGIFGSLHIGFIGEDSFSDQIGINEYGVAYDYNAVPTATLVYNSSKPLFPDYYWYQTCKSVEEAITFFTSYSPVENTSISAQIHIADPSGDAVVISVGSDGNNAITRKNNSQNYLISTNFNVATTSSEYIICWRFEAAEQRLELIKEESDLSVESVRDVLDATSQDITRFSYIFDLKNRNIYLYNATNFEKVVKINFNDELAKGEQIIPFTDYFTTERSTPNDISSILFVLICLAILTSLNRKKGL